MYSVQIVWNQVHVLFGNICPPADAIEKFRCNLIPQVTVPKIDNGINRFDGKIAVSHFCRLWRMAISLVTFDTGQEPSCSSRDVWRQDISGGMSHLSAHSIEAQELQHEEEILRNPYNLKAWWNFLAYKKDSPPITRYVIYERSLKFLPRSYKLWHAYLQERSAALINKCIADKGYSILENTYERALVNMYKMPRIWCVIAIFISPLNFLLMLGNRSCRRMTHSKFKTSRS